ncbi:hypothetical protein VPG91_23130 [Nitrospirillum amazonense]|uniref:hypothetical protein n=1 Tax=Nitrospirillum amazonense TaxID=28077 RepID=UPI002DD41F26|nr:hypothetical protein [Nitrospirillum amazonense]MEC4593912.1 hypothetical protein [Nitrospirillum amazonense]
MSNDLNFNPFTPREAFALVLDRIFRSNRLANKSFDDIGVHHRTIGGWRKGNSFPLHSNFEYLLGGIKARGINTEELETAYRLASARDLSDQFSDNVETKTIEDAARQVPAAYRFGIYDQKIDALPENPETLDREIAQDLYDAFARKLDELILRLNRSNADAYAASAVERVRGSLGGNFDEMRPGVVLGHFRTIEAIVAGFDTEEGRAALFPDAIAIFNDVNLTGQDLLACFPNVRRIERARIAADIEKNPEVIKEIRRQTGAIKTAAAESGIVAPGALKALRENDPDIEQAGDVGLVADLTADEALISRNFVGELLRSAWDVVGDDLKAGSKIAARILPPLAVIALVTLIAGPIGGLAAVVRGDLFKTVRGGLEAVQATRRGGKILQVEPLDLFPSKAASKQLGISLRHFRALIRTNMVEKPHLEVKKGKSVEYFVTNDWIERTKKVLERRDSIARQLLMGKR